jgi:hypothetical protein
MSIWHDMKTKIDVWCGQLSIDQSKFDQSATMRVRRVKPESEPEHVQLDVTINKHGEKRTTTQSFCFMLSPEAVEKLILGLTKLHPPYDPTKNHYVQIREQEAKAREFYELV